MSKIAIRLLTPALATVIGVLSYPAQAEPRNRHSTAAWEVLPAPHADAADAVQAGPEVIQNAPFEAVQKVPLGVMQKGPLDAVPLMPLAAVQKGQITCCPSPGCGCPRQRRIDYRNHCRLRKGAYVCAPPVQTVLVVPDGRCGQCAIEVPVWIPACCTDAPQVAARRGLLGRTRVLYRWCCGFEVEVVFCANGDLIVHYDGV
jgi:hypothetical protein